MRDFEYEKIENGISIDSKAFAENHNITSITIPDSVANIKKNALDCFNIKKIIFIGRKKLDEIELADEWKGICNSKIVFKPEKTGFFGLPES